MYTSACTNKVLRAGAALALVCAGMSAHADSLNPIVGGGLGAMAGAFIGQSMGGRDGAMIGAAVGGVAGVGIASNSERRRPEVVHNVVYEQPYRVAPVAPVVYAPAYAPAYGYRVVERVNYYPEYRYVQHGWHEHGRGWERHEEYRHDGDFRGGEHRGWDRRD